MLLSEFIEGQQNEVTLTALDNLKHDEFVALLKVICPLHEKLQNVLFENLLNFQMYCGNCEYESVKCLGIKRLMLI
uniref:Uncharacterized protein n=1 Tax=Acrobeloides nanus TaxID=290746 RepID=A0A914D3T2_9BILA